MGPVLRTELVVAAVMAAKVDRHAVRRLIVLAGLVAVAIQVPTVAAGELRGEVRSVSGEVVTIRCDGGVSPNPGDPVRIGFEVPGVGFVPLEGSWKVSLIGPGGEVQAAPTSGTHGEPQAGHIALIETVGAVTQPRQVRGPAGASGSGARGSASGVDRSGLPPIAQKPWMGVRLTRVDDSAKTGVPVDGVLPGGPADRAGIKAGDVIASINGTPIPNSSALETATQNFRAGDRLVIRLLRLPDMVEVVVSPELPSLENPAVQTTIGVAFLNGKQEPTLEQFNAGPNVMGIIYRIFIDVGCKSLDFRGMQKNTA